jgi:hypothetical protein
MLYPDTLQDEALLEMQSNTSPWTELFQEEDAAAAETQRSAAESSAAAWHSADDERPTHDALSAIFWS